MARMINAHGFKLPVIRIQEGKYLIGTESKSVMIKNTTCVVRIGGGFENLETYITGHEQYELEKLKKMMEDGNRSFSDVVRELLNKYKADPAVVNQFMKTIREVTIKQAVTNTINAHSSPKRNDDDN